MTRDVAYEKVQMRNRELTDKLEELENLLQQRKQMDQSSVSKIHVFSAKTPALLYAFSQSLLIAL